jgi:hypothetical protein
MKSFHDFEYLHTSALAPAVLLLQKAIGYTDHLM